MIKRNAWMKIKSDTGRWKIFSTSILGFYRIVKNIIIFLKNVLGEYFSEKLHFLLNVHISTSLVQHGFVPLNYHNSIFSELQIQIRK